MTVLHASATAHRVRLPRVLRQAIAVLLQGLLDVLRHGDLPGYTQLPWLTRCRLNMQAFLAFTGSLQFIRLTLWLIVWLLASYLLVWTYDLRGPAAATPPLLALLWVLPWFAHARRNEVARLLRYRWPG